MPRQKKPESLKVKGKWTNENLLEAIYAVANGSSIGKAGAKYGVPYSTLRGRMRIGLISAPKLGRSTVFTPEQESEMAEEIKALTNIFHGLTPLQIRTAAFDFAVKHGIPHTFNVDKKQAGRAWFDRFITRHPDIATRRAENSNLSHLNVVHKDDIPAFLDNWEKLIEKHNFPPSRIFNVDETTFSVAPETVIARNATVICAYNAAGQYVPPMFIFPEQQMAPGAQNGGPPGAIYHCTPNGSSNTALFLIWLKHFKDFKRPTKENPVALILDNNESHVSIEIFEFCRENGILLIALPPQVTHRMPLLLSFFSQLKSAFKTEKETAWKQSKVKKITAHKATSAFHRAYISVASVENAVAGFAASGVWPVDRDKFADDDDVPSTDVLRTLIEDSASVPDSEEFGNDQDVSGSSMLDPLSLPSADGSHEENMPMNWFQGKSGDSVSPSVQLPSHFLASNMMMTGRSNDGAGSSTSAAVEGSSKFTNSQPRRSSSVPRNFSPVSQTSDLQVPTVSSELPEQELPRLRSANRKAAVRPRLKDQIASIRGSSAKGSKAQLKTPKDAALSILRSLSLAPSNQSLQMNKKRKLEGENSSGIMTKRSKGHQAKPTQDGKSASKSAASGGKTRGRKRTSIDDDHDSVCVVCEDDDKDENWFRCPKCCAWSHAECARASR